MTEVNDFVNQTNKKAKELNDSFISDFFNASSLSISHENIVVNLLEKIFNDTDGILSWWLYEKDYGRNDNFKMWDKFENEIDISTSEKLYDYLIQYK